MTRKVRAILIGAPNTADAPTVPRAVTLVNRFAGFLEKQFGSTNATIVELVDTDATHAKVVHELAAARQAASDGELFVLLFAGHGVPSSKKQPFQAWALHDTDRFSDLELAQALLAFDAKVDAVVISACCYGEGLFSTGPYKHALNHPWPPLPTPHELDIHLQLRMWNQQRVTFLRCALAAKNSPMVCISAAGRDEVVIASVIDQLADDIEISAVAKETYRHLADRFDDNEFAGRAFQVDARPAKRLHDTVLGTQ